MASYVDRPNATSRASWTWVGVVRIVSTAARIASSRGQPYTPAETRGNAIVRAPSSSATFSAFA